MILQCKCQGQLLCSSSFFPQRDFCIPALLIVFKHSYNRYDIKQPWNHTASKQSGIKDIKSIKRNIFPIYEFNFQNSSVEDVSSKLKVLQAGFGVALDADQVEGIRQNIYWHHCGQYPGEGSSLSTFGNFFFIERNFKREIEKTQNVKKHFFVHWKKKEK